VPVLDRFTMTTEMAQTTSAWRCHYSVDELRELQRTAPPSRAPITNGEPEAEAEAPSD
jgi:hypothetical protein